MLESTSRGRSTWRSIATSGKFGNSSADRVLRWKELFWHVRWIVPCPPSKVMEASARFFTMLPSTRPEMTVSPGSSTLAGILWRMEVSRSLVCISSVPLSARMRTPLSTGSVECVAMPLETTARAFANADWETVKRMGFSPICSYI